ncbi:MAG: anthranilate phosphoribosyltransferase [Parvularculaceae bacterium]
MILLIDNYDSFTYNLAHLIGAGGREVIVKRNDEISVDAALAEEPDAIILSPGPRAPDDAGICLDLVRAAAVSGTPVFGVCHGMQAIAQAFGGRIVRARSLMHGKVSAVAHEGAAFLAGLPARFDAARYHSLAAEAESLPRRLEVVARSDDGEIMAVADREAPIAGVQFHPESIASDHGAALLEGFLAWANGGRPAAATNGGRGLRDALAALADGRALSPDEMTAAVGALLDGAASDAEIAGFLMGLRARGETAPEIAAAARAMRARATPVDAPEDVVDTCGTGGDGAGTLNISTAAALIAAGAGARVAKHGNRASSSKSGSSDVLAALGVDMDAGPERAARAIREAGSGYMPAVLHHRATARVGAARRALGVRTIFNFLGPLTNPAGARRQLLGVFDASYVRPVAEALAELGATRAWVVHGSDGLDELTIAGPSRVASLKDGSIEEFEVAPEDAGLSRSPLEAVRGGAPAENAAALRALLDGAPGAYRDIAVLNAAAALIVADRAGDLRDGAAQAARAIDDGSARRALERLIAISGGDP